MCLAALNLIRLSFAGSFELVPQEAYYWIYSRHLALSYFDHPPMIAYLIRLSSLFWGHRPMCLRFAAWITSLLFQLAALAFARPFLRARRDALFWLVLPATGMVSIVSLIATPDVPLLLFWSLSLCLIYRAVLLGRVTDWLLSGLTMGLAFDSKYTGIFLQFGMVLFLLASPKYRGLLKTRRPYLSLLVAQLTMAPVYLWNAQHGFSSFLFQTRERASASHGLQLKYLLGLIGSQSALLSVPLIIALAGVAILLVRDWKKWTGLDRTRDLFLICFFLPLFLTFSGLSLVLLVKPNWLMPSYISGTVLAVRLFRPHWLKWHFASALLVHALAAIELIFYPVALNSDDTWFGWKALANQVELRMSRHVGTFVFSADGYKTTAELMFYTALPVYGSNVIGERALQFDYLDDDLVLWAGHDALFLDSAPNDLSARKSQQFPARLQGYFRTIEEEEPILIRSGHRLVRKFYVYACRDYRPPARR